MIEFSLNIFLAFAWVGLTEEVTVANFGIGFILSYLVLRFSRRSQGYLAGYLSYLTKIRQIIGFLLFFLKELIIANFRVTYEVLAPTSMQTMRSGIVAIPLDIQSHDEITLMANFITLTPGTLSLEVSEDHKILYVHAMHIDDLDSFKKELKERLEARVAEVWR